MGKSCFCSDRQEAAIDDLYAKVDSTQQKVEYALRFTDRLINGANGVELVASRKKVTLSRTLPVTPSPWQVMHQLRSLECTMPTMTTEVELKFIPTERRKLESQLAMAMGIISCTFDQLHDMPNLSLFQAAPFPLP